MIKIVHLTSVHPRHDSRIFYKMCESLAKAGFDVTLLVADGKGYEEKSGVKIFDIGKPTSIFERIFLSTLKIFRASIHLDADIYHFHDPELLLVAYMLKIRGKTIIFDFHEDVPEQMLAKPYLTPFILKVLSLLYSYLERVVAKAFDCLVAATPHIKSKLLQINSHVENINNYPIIHELKLGNLRQSSNQVCYIGGVTQIRGCYEMIRSMDFTNKPIKLVLAGDLSGVGLSELQCNKHPNRIQYLGFQDRDGVKSILSSSFAGLVTLWPVSNYVESLPIKLFEYMSAGLPVICSNFPLWREIVQGNNCGICVDPLNPEDIAKAIDWLYEHPDLALQMGQNGQMAVAKLYNWQNEENKLLALYQKLIEYKAKANKV